jgi:exocyst complex component 2
MADQTRVILNHYNISSPDPTSWPAEKDESDESEGEIARKAAAAGPRPRSKSRYTILERRGSDSRGLVPGSEKTRDGVENLVQKDEPDPLGATDSVVRALRRKGLPVEEDHKLRKHPGGNCYRPCRPS